MHGRFLASAALVATLALLSGCGGSSSSSNQMATFKKGYEAMSARLTTAGETVGGTLKQARSKSDAQLNAAFRSLASRWQTELSEVETLQPPSSLKADFNTVTSAGSRVESDLTALVDASATRNESAGAQAYVSLLTDFQTIRTADAALKHALAAK